MLVRLVRFEAWNISRFLFVTNKRREIAGASELITYLDRRWVNGALAETFAGFGAGWRIEEAPAELVEAGAGTATVLVVEGADARALVGRVTLAALAEAPGLDVFGVVSEPFEWGVAGGLAGAVGQVREAAEAVRMGRPGPPARFRRLPVVAECASTGLPAWELATDPDGELVARSAESRAKWVAYGQEDGGDGLGRLADLAGVRSRDLKAAVRELNDAVPWVGVVYADVNGLGSAFEALAAAGAGQANREYAEALRSFSDALRECAGAAVRAAVGEARSELPAEVKSPVVPLIAGGDDLVLICAGAVALPLARAYLLAFERLTAEHPGVSAVLARLGRPRLSCSAGVAIVKAHFPFEPAARLAEALLHAEAKQVKDHVVGPCSALAFHVLYDSTEVELPRIRAATSREPSVRLVAQPYVVGDADSAWARGRAWEDLVRRVAALVSRDEEGERRVPGSQAHDLREALFMGRAVADSRYANLRGRYPELAALAGHPGSLFWRESGGDYVTGLLDAMDAAEFLPVQGVAPGMHGPAVGDGMDAVELRPVREG
jgi:hypothetical protein